MKGSRPRLKNKKSKIIDDSSSSPIILSDEDLTFPLAYPSKKKAAKLSPSLEFCDPRILQSGSLSTSKAVVTLLEDYLHHEFNSEPQNLEDLAVHKKKITDVKNWLADSKSPLLLLQGPPGSGKTTLIKLVAKSLNYFVQEIVEPDIPCMTTSRNNTKQESLSFERNTQPSAPNLQQEFHRSISTNSLLFYNPVDQSQLQSKDDEQTTFEPNSASKVILIEFFSVHTRTHRNKFSESLEVFLRQCDRFSMSNLPKVCVILSDDLGLTAAELRELLPSSIASSPLLTKITLNPIAKSFMLKSLSKLIAGSACAKGSNPDALKDILESVVDISVGDIRSAVLNLNWLLLLTSSKIIKNQGTIFVGRETAASSLFHLVAHFLYRSKRIESLPDMINLVDRTLVVSSSSTASDGGWKNAEGLLFAYLFENYLLFVRDEDDFEQISSLCDQFSVLSYMTSWHAVYLNDLVIRTLPLLAARHLQLRTSFAVPQLERQMADPALKKASNASHLFAFSRPRYFDTQSTSKNNSNSLAKPSFYCDILGSRSFFSKSLRF